MKIELDVPIQRIADMFIGAFEGGSNHWADKVVDLSNWKKPKGNKLVWWGWTEYWDRPDFKIEIHDGEADETHVVDRAAVEKGLQIFAEECPSHFADMLLDEDDADTHDAFLQCVVFGEVVYG